MDNHYEDVLLVEDDQIDQMSTARAFKDLRIANPLAIRENGQEALDYLRDDANRKPCLILLDINMPCMNGIEFLKEVRVDETLKSIPIVVLTTSREDEDRFQSSKLGAVAFLNKPVDYKGFVEVIRKASLYVHLTQLP